MHPKYFEKTRETPLFTYAVISDTHMRPEAGDESSPWEVNRYANDRARWVIDRIERTRPDFVVHMGDIVHPFPRLSTYASAAEAAVKAHGVISTPLYYIPGNHDVGDKKNPVMPAHAVDEFGLESYEKWFGPLHQSFDHKDLHLILINAQALNSGLAYESKQKQWLEADFAANREKRIHVFSHYPPYVLDRDEPNNYDNIDEPARSWLLDLLETYRVEALFAGHVHHFIYQQHGVTECYNLFATSFVRQDYAEMFRVAAADEYGRNDREKLGWCVVDVYKSTHIARIHRSNGALLGPVAAPEPEVPRVGACHTKDSVVAPLGVHLRHPWAEVVDLPYNGPLDEFIRKRVRNDYTILGLWECGIRLLRVPIGDLMDDRLRSRMAALARIGHRFSVFCSDLPSKAESAVLEAHAALMRSVELILPWKRIGDRVDAVSRLRRALSVPLFVGNIRSSADQHHDGSKFSHYVSFGFLSDQTDQLEAWLAEHAAAHMTDGFIFTVGAGESPRDAVSRIHGDCAKAGRRAVVNIRLASENPAEFACDDLWTANRVAEAMMAAAAAPSADVYLDTFMDLDRGYFPRIGLYDRRLNRRPASHVFAHLQGVLNRYGADTAPGRCSEIPAGRLLVYESPAAAYCLFLPAASGSRPLHIAFSVQVAPGPGGAASVIPLDSGTIRKVDWHRKADAVHLDIETADRAPTLIAIEKKT